MKILRLAISLLAFASYSVFSSHIEYGDLDTFVDQASVVSGDESERLWVAAALGLDEGDVSLEWKYEEDSPGDNWTEDGAGIFVRDLSTPFDYFLVKMGHGGKPSTTGVDELFGATMAVPVFGDSHYLFKNNDSLGHAYVDFTAAGLEIDRISHITAFAVAAVSEPESLALVILGLMLVCGVKRQRLRI